MGDFSVYMLVVKDAVVVFLFPGGFQDGMDVVFHDGLFFDLFHVDGM